MKRLPPGFSIFTLSGTAFTTVDGLSCYQARGCMKGLNEYMWKKLLNLNPNYGCRRRWITILFSNCFPCQTNSAIYYLVNCQKMSTTPLYSEDSLLYMWKDMNEWCHNRSECVTARIVFCFYDSFFNFRLLLFLLHDWNPKKDHQVVSVHSIVTLFFFGGGGVSPREIQITPI